MSDYLEKRNEGINFLNLYNPNTFKLINEENLNKAIPCFQESINNAPNEEEIYKSSILMEETYEKLISGIEKDTIYHQDIYNKYMYYSSNLMKTLSTNLKLSNKFNDPKTEKINLSAKNVIMEIPLKDIGSNAYEMIENFIDEKETYYFLISNLMRHYLNEGIKLYEKGESIPAKNMFNIILNEIFKHYKLDDNLEKLEIKEEIKEDIEDIIESAIFYVKRIDAEILIKKGDQKLNEALNESDEIDMDDVTESLTYYRNALNEINKSKLTPDIELEAICFSNIAKIMYRIFKNKKKIDKIKGYVSQSVNLGLSLSPKNVGNEKWYIEATNILQEIRDEELKEEEKNNDLLRTEMMKKEESIFLELNEKKKESNIAFIKFILEKYPYKGYKNDGKNIEEEFSKDNKNFIKTLVAKYHPDRYPKNTEEEKKHYVIIHEISVILNGMYSIYDSVNRKDA